MARPEKVVSSQQQHSSRSPNKLSPEWRESQRPDVTELRSPEPPRRPPRSPRRTPTFSPNSTGGPPPQRPPRRRHSSATSAESVSVVSNSATKPDVVAVQKHLTLPRSRSAHFRDPPVSETISNHTQFSDSDENSRSCSTSSSVSRQVKDFQDHFAAVLPQDEDMLLTARSGHLPNFHHVFLMNDNSLLHS